MTASINSNTSEATPRTLVVLDVDGWEAVAVLTLLRQTPTPIERMLIIRLEKRGLRRFYSVVRYSHNKNYEWGGALQAQKEL